MAEARQEAMLIADCPRCGHARTTFDLLAATFVGKLDSRDEFECFLRCRSCYKPSIGLLRQKQFGDSTPTQFKGSYIDLYFSLIRWVFEIPGSRQVADHVPNEISAIFREGANCVAIGAWDASGAMFRKVLDAATRERTPTPDSTANLKPANWKTYKDLRLRLDWLFANDLLDRSLADLSSCIHQDGNDAAHDLTGIGKEEAEDLSDFTDQVLRVIFTIPGQISENKARRAHRRGEGLP